MQLGYGTYLFPVGQSEITAEAETQLNGYGLPYAQKKRFHVKGKLNVSGQADCTAQMNALMAALAIPYQELVLYQDGGAPSATVLTNVGSTSGVRVVEGPNFPESRGAVYATYQTFEFVAEAEYRLTTLQNLLLSFTETLSFSGGGPLYAHMPSVNTLPQKQKIYEATPYQVTQSGQAVGWRTWYKPAAIWPDALKQAPKYDKVTPDRRGRRWWQGYASSWQYLYESATPLLANPTLWNW